MTELRRASFVLLPRRSRSYSAWYVYPAGGGHPCRPPPAIPLRPSLRRLASPLRCVAFWAKGTGLAEDSAGYGVAHFGGADGLIRAGGQIWGSQSVY